MGTFSKSEVLQLIRETSFAIDGFNRAKTLDRRAFAILVLFRART